MNRLHLGCGGTKLLGFVNVDVERTNATDIVRDCSNLSEFESGSASLIFSHAFFEHFCRHHRIPFLIDARRVLRNDGHVFFCGMPDFEMVARCYLGKTKGQVMPIFDLFEVYRCTHGIPEWSGDPSSKRWNDQLHKSLFDKDDLKVVLNESGFPNSLIFRYAFRDEPNPICLGFVAAKDNSTVSPQLLKSFLGEVSSIIGNNSPQILCG